MQWRVLSRPVARVAWPQGTPLPSDKLARHRQNPASLNVMMELAISDLTRGLGVVRRFDPSLLVDMRWFELDPDEEGLTAAWISDGRIEDPFELTPSEVIALSLYEAA